MALSVVSAAFDRSVECGQLFLFRSKSFHYHVPNFWMMLVSAKIILSVSAKTEKVRLLFLSNDGSDKKKSGTLKNTF